MLTKERILNQTNALLESLAYLIAFWNLLVLFFEPVVKHYLILEQTLAWTAATNVVFLFITILIRLSLKSFTEQKTRTITDIFILVVGALLSILDAKFLIFFLLTRQTFFIVQFIFFHAFDGALYKRLIRNPPVTFMLSFAVIILLGSFLLMLPSATNAHVITPFIDALFTATSATCVTGLIVVDTPVHFSLFGQLVIMFLIQIGGLGIMTISTAFAILLGQKLTMKVENVMQNVVGESLKIDMLSLIKNIVVLTLTFEAVGATFMFFTFIKSMEPIRAFYFAIFHSVSAFCNAGFALYSDNLMSFVSNVNINMVITLLIIFGGLGFSVIVEIWRHLTNSKKRFSMSLHTKIVVSTTAILLVFGTVAFFISEFNNTMRGNSIPQRVLSSWFQSVTCRTAGFNTIDETIITPASALVSMILMFIGASPGSTGGGVKTSTFALLFLSIITLMRGQTEVTVFRRKISSGSIRESSSLIIISALLIFGIVYVILLIDPFTLEKTLFEAISAFGTVGLSMGITADMSTISKFLITLLMYIGRVGPLTLLFALAQRRKIQHYTLAEEKVTIG